MFRKTLTAAVAVLTLTGATLTTTQSAQAGSLGKAVAIGIVGAAVGAIAGAVSARSEEAGSRYDDRSDDRSGGFRQARGGYEGGFRQVRGGYDQGCGVRVRPVFDEYGNKVGVRNVPAC